MTNIPIALNLYSLAKDCERDLAGTLAEIARMGFKGVEFMTYYGRSAAELRRMLDDLGLKAAGVHIGSPGMGLGTCLEMLQGDNLQRTVEFSTTLGNKYIMVSALDHESMQTRAAWLGFAADLNEAAARLRPYGIHTGYHSDGWEFRPVEGEAPWDTLAANTDEDVVLQLDTMTFAEQGGDPIYYLGKYAHRALTVHVVEYAKDNWTPLIGEGDIPWPEVFRICEAGGKTEWYIMEQERQPYPPLESVERSLENLRGILAQCNALRS
jgi:sugar phosphate isomerase/epimerase